MRRFTTAPLLAALVCLLGAECEEQPEEDPISEVDRSDIGVTDDGAWASCPWDVEDPDLYGMIEIKPKHRIELFHGLGRTPIQIHAYVGFSEEGERMMPASGNAAEIWEVDDVSLIVRNGSGGSVYYRFVLR